MEILLLILILAFLIVYSLGLGSFFSANLNIALIMIGLAGCIIATVILGKRLENIRKKRLEYEEKQLEAIKKNVHAIKLQDNGTDIDEVYKRLKEKDMHIDFKLKE